MGQNRVIEIAVLAGGGVSITAQFWDKNNAKPVFAIQGEHRATLVRCHFPEEWDGLRKYVLIKQPKHSVQMGSEAIENEFYIEASAALVAGSAILQLTAQNENTHETFFSEQVEGIILPALDGIDAPLMTGDLTPYPITKVYEAISAAEDVANHWGVETAVENAVVATSNANQAATAANAVIENIKSVPVGGVFLYPYPETVSAPYGFLDAYGQTVSRSDYSELFQLLSFDVTVSSGSIGSNTLTLSGTTGIDTGASIEGDGIPSGTKINSITGNTVLISNFLTKAVSAKTIKIFNHGNGDGSTTFHVPDFRKKAPVGFNPGDTDNIYNIAGNKIGEEKVKLEVQNLPSHTHTIKANYDLSNNPKSGTGERINSCYEGGSIIWNDLVMMINNTGGDQPHNNVPPSIVTRFIIAAFSGAVGPSLIAQHNTMSDAHQDIRNTISNLNTGYTVLSDEVSAETAHRQNADTAFTQALEQEATARENAIASLDNAKVNKDGAKVLSDFNYSLEDRLAVQNAKHDKGFYTTQSALVIAFPTGSNGDHAIVGATDTTWVWDSASGTWKDSDTKGQVVSVNGKSGEVLLTYSDIGAQQAVEGKGLSANDYTAEDLAAVFDMKQVGFSDIYMGQVVRAVNTAVNSGTAQTAVMANGAQNAVTATTAKDYDTVNGTINTKFTGIEASLAQKQNSPIKQYNISATSIILGDATFWELSGTLTTLSINVNSTPPAFNVSTVDFETGAAISVTISTTVSGLAFVYQGKDVSGGIFTPVANTRYNLVFYYDCKRVVVYVC